MRQLALWPRLGVRAVWSRHKLLTKQHRLLRLEKTTVSVRSNSTKSRSDCWNVERFNGTVLEELFRVLGRTKFYESIQEMQNDLDAYVVTYNTQKPHQGRGMNGRTPADVFPRCLPKTKIPKEDKMGKAT